MLIIFKSISMSTRSRDAYLSKNIYGCLDRCEPMKNLVIHTITLSKCSGQYLIGLVNVITMRVSIPEAQKSPWGLRGGTSTHIHTPHCSVSEHIV